MRRKLFCDDRRLLGNFTVWRNLALNPNEADKEWLIKEFDMNTAIKFERGNSASMTEAVANTNSLIFKLDPSRANLKEEWFVGQFAERVIGQPEALQVALQAYNAAHNPLRDMSRPIGIYLLIGPSRTGKTLTAETLALLFHGNKDALIRLQGGDYRQEHQVLDLKGAPPSYVGYKDPSEDKGKLAAHEVDPVSVISNHNLKRVRRGSESAVNIILLDESEKAGPEFFKLWMGIFDTGTLRLGNGEMVDFSNTIFIMTSNLGMAQVEKLARGGIGFTSGEREVTKQDVQSVVAQALMQVYPPEFRNRIDAVVIFQPLQDSDMKNIVKHELDLVQERIDTQLGRGQAFALRVTEPAQDYLLKETLSKHKSIAELKRVLTREIVMPLGRELQRGAINGGDVVVISLGETGVLSFAVERGVTEDESIAARVAGQSSRFQFRLQRAQQIVELMLSEGHQLAAYSLRCPIKKAALIQKELEQVFLAHNVRSEVEGDGGLVFSFRTVEDMSVLVREYYGELEIARR